MATKILFPDHPYPEQRVSLNNKVYILSFKFNTRNQSWAIDIKDTNNSVILAGIKVMPNQNLTGRYKATLPSLPQSGSIWCLRIKDTKKPIGRDNFGNNKDYQLFFILDDEFEGVDLSGVIQL